MGLTREAEVVDALFAGDPSTFVADRDAAAKAARAAGDRESASRIKALRRPSVAAWYVNVAARSSLVSLREWLALGASLREAQERLDMAEVRRLGAGRAGLENRVVRDLAAHLATLGTAASPAALDEVRATLRAALADPAASALVASGRLERALTYGGFGEVDLSAALAAMATASATSDAATDEDAGESTEEQTAPDPALLAALKEARAHLSDAEATRDAASDAVARAEGALAVAQRQLREAKQALAASEKEVDAAERAVRSAGDALG